MTRQHISRFAKHGAAALLAVLAFAPAAAHAGVPDGAEYSQDYITGSDPVTNPTLHVDILKPKGVAKDAKLPIILSVGPYFNHSGSTTTDYKPTAAAPNERFYDMVKGAHIFERGYAFVMVDLRGFGASEGCNDFGGTGEIGQTDGSAVQARFDTPVGIAAGPHGDPLPALKPFRPEHRVLRAVVEIEIPMLAPRSAPPASETVARALHHE